MNCSQWKTLKNRQEKTELSECEITVCLGGSCQLKGSKTILKALSETLGIEPGETTADGRFCLGSASCLDRCSLAPSVAFNEKIYSQMDREQTIKMLKRYQED